MNQFTLLDLEYKTYIFYINAHSYIQSVRDLGYLQPDFEVFLFEVAKMYKIVKEMAEFADFSLDKLGNLIKICNLCKDLLSVSYKFPVNKLILNEKIDLLVEVTELKHVFLQISLNSFSR